MNVSLQWLNELLELGGDAAEVARLLTRAGVEVEGQRVVGDFSGVIVAEVRGKRPHPNAAKLTLVDVFDGQEVTQVVCGAPNVPSPGAFVLWARPGARLPDGTVLAPKEVRGVVSPGMLCAEDELGLGASHDGILILSSSDGVRPGDDAAQALGLPDVVLSLNLTPNRADCLGHVGVARELSALSGWPLRTAPPLFDVPVEGVQGTRGGEAPAGGALVEVDDRDGCLRYSALLLDGVKVGPSPLRVRVRLQSLGVRAISNVVDATNIVLLEWGQPLHAFDRDRLSGGRIVVRGARSDEKLVTLDGQERALLPGDVLICDGTAPVAVGGVMGGASSEVHDATTRLLLESALFDPTRIRRTAKRLGLHSEASHRFERGVDPSTVVVASRRCAQLLADWAGARPAGALLDVQTRPGLEVPVTVAFRPARTSALLGVEVPAAEQAALLSRLHLSVQMDREPWQVSVPTARRDLTREVDLIEEVARVWGYDRIPSTVPRLEALPTQAGDRLGDALREAARGLGFEEVITYGFVGPRQLQALGLSSDDPRSHPVLLENPLREELSALRTTLVPGLVQVLLGNVSRQVTDLCVFELGVAFLPRGAGEAPSEERHLVGLLSGTESGWLRRGAPLDVFDATGALEECLGAIGARFVLAPSSEPWLHPGKQAAIVVDGVARGFVGELHPDYRQRAGLELPAFVFEVNVEGLSVRPVEARTALPRFPAVVRDLSFFVDESVPAAQIRRVVEEAREPLVAELAVLEDYREPGRVPPGKKGMLWTLTYRAPDRTLTDDEVTAAQGRLQARLTAELAIQLRV